MRVLRELLVASVLSSVAAACSSTYTSARLTRSDPSTELTAAEIARSDATTAYEAVERLRPAFLSARSATSFLAEPPDAIVVINNRMVLGGVNELRWFSAGSVTSIRRLSAADVYQMTGRSAPGGGLEIVTRSR